jgi:hypothetical protein
LGDISIRAASELAQKIKGAKVKDDFTTRDVYRNCWHLLDTREKSEAACRELVEAGWLRPESVEIPGRHAKEVFKINPKLFS